MSITRKIVVIAGSIALAMTGIVGVSAASSSGGCAGFPDVSQDSQFCADITWMVNNDIANGYDDGHFGPTNATSRQAMSAFMHRFAATVTDGAKGAKGNTGAPGTNGENGTNGVSGRFTTNHTVSVPAGETVTYARSCNASSSHPDGGQAISGGFTFNEKGSVGNLEIVSSAPTSNADEWATTVHNADTSKAYAYLSWAVCAATN